MEQITELNKNETTIVCGGENFLTSATAGKFYSSVYVAHVFLSNHNDRLSGPGTKHIPRNFLYHALLLFSCFRASELSAVVIEHFDNEITDRKSAK